MGFILPGSPVLGESFRGYKRHQRYDLNHSAQSQSLGDTISERREQLKRKQQRKRPRMSREERFGASKQERMALLRAHPELSAWPMSEILAEARKSAEPPVSLESSDCSFAESEIATSEPKKPTTEPQILTNLPSELLERIFLYSGNPQLGYTCNYLHSIVFNPHALRQFAELLVLEVPVNVFFCSQCRRNAEAVERLEIPPGTAVLRILPYCALQLPFVAHILPDLRVDRVLDVPPAVPLTLPMAETPGAEAESGAKTHSVTASAPSNRQIRAAARNRLEIPSAVYRGAPISERMRLLTQLRRLGLFIDHIDEFSVAALREFYAGRSSGRQRKLSERQLLSKMKAVLRLGTPEGRGVSASAGSVGPAETTETTAGAGPPTDEPTADETTEDAGDTTEEVTAVTPMKVLRQHFVETPGICMNPSCQRRRSAPVALKKLAISARIHTCAPIVEALKMKHLQLANMLYENVSAESQLHVWQGICEFIRLCRDTELLHWAQEKGEVSFVG